MPRMAIALTISALAYGHSSAAGADEGGALAAKFGALEDVQQASLSPDGQQMAYVVQGDNASVVYVVGINGAGAPSGLLSMAADEGKIRSCRWITVARLVCNVQAVRRDVSGPLLTFTRSFAINADRTGLVKLSPETRSTMRYAMHYGGGIVDLHGGAPGQVLMTRQHVPTTRIGRNVGTDKEGLGVDLVDSATLKRTIVEQPRPSAFTYIADGYGAVRIVGSRLADDGYATGTSLYSFRTPDARDWAPLSKVVTSHEGVWSGFLPVAVDKAKNIAYGYDKLNGFDALYTVALDGVGKPSLLLARPDTDIDSLITVGPHARVVGATYVTEKRAAEYFDPELARLRTALGKALPDHPLIDILDASEDESKLLLLASSDIAPGTLYRYDKTTHQLGALMMRRSALADVTLATVKPVTYRAADGTPIPAYLTLPVGSAGKGIPAIVMPHGGPAARDEWGFDWLAQFYAARGYAVLQPNYRGSAGYGTGWFQKNGFQSWRTAIGDVNDAGRWLLSQGIAAPGKLAIVGWSYGGYAALQGAVTDPGLYAAVVAVAPVTDLASLKLENRFFGNARLVEKYVGIGPHVTEGSPAQNADRIAAPVLLFHGDLDQNVDVAESRLMERKLKGASKAVRYVELPGLDHYLENAAARTRLLYESDVFLRTAMKLAPQANQ